MNIQLIKLKSGEEIIGDVVATGFSEGEEFITVKKPAVVQIVPQQQTGKLGIAIVEWIPWLENQEVSIEESDIMFSGKPIDNISNAYSERFGSGIVTSSKGLLLNK